VFNQFKVNHAEYLEFVDMMRNKSEEDLEQIKQKID